MSDKGKKLHIAKEDLFDLIRQYLNAEDINKCIKSEIVKNTATNQTRYEFQNEDILFEIDIYYRKDKTITLFPLGNKDSLEHGNKLVDFVYENLEFKNVCRKTFTCLINEKDFSMLIAYLSELEGVSCEINEDKGANGHFFKYISEIGDEINLTYWQSKCKLMFQGYAMKLHAEIECLLAGLSVASEYSEDTCNKVVDLKIIDTLVKKQCPNSYCKLHDLFKDLLSDSLSLCLQKPQLKDYAVVSFPALKALEGRIKLILKNNGIEADMQFSYQRKPLFITDINGVYLLDTGLVSITDGNTITILGSCYDYYHKYRHTLFHTRQSLDVTTRILSINFAEEIIYKVCELIDNSYNILGQ